MASRIVFLGRLRDRFGASEIVVDLPASVRDQESLARFVAGADDQLSAALQEKSVRLAADRKILARGEGFDVPDEIAFMPPFSGG